MGMDVILGAIVLVTALRGWFRGFFAQAIRIGGLVGAVYAAGPLRDLARPIAADRLTSMSPELLDRLLWWVAAAVSFVVLTGVATGMLGSYRRRRALERSAEGMTTPRHGGDQSAGLLLGAAKGAIVVAFLAAAIHQYAPDYLKAGGWVGEQVQTSHALAWSAKYEPARRLWESEPVRHFVAHVRRMGLASDAEAETETPPDDRAVAADAEGPPADAQARAPSVRPAPMAVEGLDDSERSPEADLNAALDEVRRDLERLDSLRRLASP